MPQGRQYIEFEGQYSESMLSISRIIWSFADLREMAAVSLPDKMEES